MSRKSFLLGIGILGLLLGGGGAVTAVLVWHEPDFYRRFSIPPEVRLQRSQEFQTAAVQIYNDIQGDQPWRASFTEDQINSWFDEDFVHSGLDERMLPEGITAPRVAIESDKIRLAFRYGSGVWSAVVSIDLRLWLAGREPNVVALELQGLHAGSLPISAQSLMERLSEAGRRSNVEVSWYRHNGNPVALLRFQADRDRPTVQLQWLELQQGKLTIGGQSIEASPVRAMLTPSALRPSAN